MNVGDESVQLLAGVLVLVALSGKLDTDASGNVPNALAPQEFVQRDVKTNVLRAHHLLSKLLDLLDGAGSAVLERPAKRMDVITLERKMSKT